jgi:hypothetical protein
MRGFRKNVFRISMLAVSSVGLAFGQTNIHITSPKDRAVVRPGETVALTVEITGSAPKSVFVIGVSPIGLQGELKAPPFKLSVAIPKEISSGPYLLTASAATSTGDLKDDEVTVDVERSDSPGELRPDHPSLRLHINEEFYPVIIGTFSWDNERSSGIHTDRADIQRSGGGCNRPRPKAQGS